MTAQTDPTKTKFWPESLPECFNTASVGTGGVEVASYTRFAPFCVELEDVALGASTSVDTNIYANGLVAARMHNEGGPNIQKNQGLDKIIADESLQISQTGIGGTRSNVKTRYAITVRKPTLIDRIRLYGIDDLSETEKALAATMKLEQMIKSGEIGRHDYLLGEAVKTKFDEIITVPRRLPTIAAGGSSDIGPSISVPPGKVLVLLGIAIDAVTVQGAVGYGDTFVYVDRDDDINYIKLDAAAMPGTTDADANYLQRMYIPAVSELRVFVVSATGLASGIEARFIYGMRDLTYVDRIKWNLGYKNKAETQEAETYITENGLREKVAAGIL